jgi:hypothetical protein
MFGPISAKSGLIDDWRPTGATILFDNTVFRRPICEQPWMAVSLPSQSVTTANPTIGKMMRGGNEIAHVAS